MSFVAYFLAIVAHASTYPVNKKVIEAAGGNWAGEVGTLVSNGPFKVSEWIHGSKLTMVKNEQYWDKDKVRISRLEWALLEVKGNIAVATGLVNYKDAYIEK